MQYTAQQRAESSDEWLVIPFPAEKDNPVVTDGVSYGLLKSDDPSELAGWLFIRWLSGQSQQAGLLETLGTLPLGGDVRDSMAGYETKYPNWKTAVETLDNLVTLPVLADWQVVRPIVEDAAWQLYKTDLKMEQIPEVLKQMDDLSEELSERYP